MNGHDEAAAMVGQAHLRIARPSTDLPAAERFWVGGLGLEVLFRSGPTSPHALLMLGSLDGAWHLELLHDPDLAPQPTEEDLLVLYLGGEVPNALLERLREHGGTQVPARNPYWDEWGVTLEDPDGYRLVLSTRSWANTL